MHPHVRDRVVRPLASTVSRRAAVGGTLAAALVALAEARHPAEAKKKKKKKGCKFTTVGSTMTLTASCTTTKSIQVPAGFTLDGVGLTITGSGSAKAIRDGIIVAKNGKATVHDLIIDGSLLKPFKGQNVGPNGVLFRGNDNSIFSSNVMNVANQANGVNGDDAEVDISDTLISGCSTGVFAGGGSIGISTSEIHNAFFGLFAARGGKISMTGGSLSPVTQVGAEAAGADSVVTLDGVTIGGTPLQAVAAYEGGTANVINSTLTTTQHGVYVTSSASASTGNVNGTTITLAAPGAPGTYGIYYTGPGSGGFSDHNTISGFFASSGTDACGIRVAPGSTADIGTHNTFPDPPGNEHDICNA